MATIGKLKFFDNIPSLTRIKSFPLRLLGAPAGIFVHWSVVCRPSYCRRRECPKSIYFGKSHFNQVFSFNTRADGSPVRKGGPSYVCFLRAFDFSCRKW